MSNKMERIVGKAVLDAAFRDALIADPEAALAAAEINLGKKQMEALKAGIERYKQDTAAQSLLSSSASTAAAAEFWR